MPLYPLVPSITDPTDSGYDLILLLGQSNAVGFASDGDFDRFNIGHPDVWQYGVTGDYADMISLAVEPLAHPDDSSTGVGAGLQLARWYRNIVPSNRRVLLVPAAHGGTGLSTDRTLGWKRGVTGNLYDQAITQTQDALTAAGANSRVVAATWLHGETDSAFYTNADTHRADLDALITGLRVDLGVPDLPFVIGGMVPGFDHGYAFAIRAVQADTPYRLAHTAFCDGPAGMTQVDGLHYTSRGYEVLSRSMLAAYLDARTRTAPLSRSVPGQVTGLIAGITSATAIDLEWETATDAVTYTIERKLASGSTWAVVGVTGATRFTSVGLAEATAYDFRVSATNGGGTGDVSAKVGASTDAHAVFDSFTRANSGSLGSTEAGSKSWSTTGGSGWAIASNALAWTGTAGGGAALVDSGLSDDYEMSFTVVALNGQYPITPIVQGTTTSHILFIFRDQVEDAWTLLNYDASGNVVKGTQTDLVAGDVVTVRVQGTTVTLLVNGHLQAEWTGISYQSGGTIQGVQGNDDLALTVDDFSVSPIFAPVVADTFNRANGSMGSTDTGAEAWQAIGASGWAISSDAAAWTGTGDGSILVDSGLSDDYEVQFTCTSVTGTYPIAVIVRGTSTSAYGKIYRNQSSNEWVYADTNAVSSAQSAATDLASGDVIRVRVDGTTVTLFLNGVQQAQWTGFTAFSGGTYQGIGGSGNLAATVDDFSVTPV